MHLSFLIQLCEMSCHDLPRYSMLYDVIRCAVVCHYKLDFLHYVLFFSFLLFYTLF